MEGKLGGAAIDVYATEPPNPDNPLFALTGEAALRVLFTPHIAGITRQAWQGLFRTAWQNVEDVLLRDAPVRHKVY
jgi:phosphoglycerate dehydrogenase-like enzyme